MGAGKKVVKVSTTSYFVSFHNSFLKTSKSQTTCEDKKIKPKIFSYIWMCMKLNTCIRKALLLTAASYDHFLKYLIGIIIPGLKAYVGYFNLG